MMDSTILLSIFGAIGVFTLGGVFWGGYNLGTIKTKLQNHDRRLEHIDSNIEVIKKDMQEYILKKNK